MPRLRILRSSLTRYLDKIPRKLMYLVTFISFSIAVIGNLNRLLRQYPHLHTNKKFIDINELFAYSKILIEEEKNLKFLEKVQKRKDLKFILLWTEGGFGKPYNLGLGRNEFVNNNCTYKNCFVTANRRLFGGNLSRFDAIGFDGRFMKKMHWTDLPRTRYPHQKYIFFNKGSPATAPVCNEIFDNFFNWTATYKLDSDIPLPYILIKNKKGEIVGPKKRMFWLDDNKHKVDLDLPVTFQSKNKAAMWIASSCESVNNREIFAYNLQDELFSYDLIADIYGECAELKCKSKADCEAKVAREYYFYMSLESEFAVDYVSDTLLTALQHDAIPVVYGGANYNRFLQPFSYINARNHSLEELAGMMSLIIQHPDIYYQHFRWKSFYTYHKASAQNVCAVCDALNNKKMVETVTVHKHFRKWWNKSKCRYQG